VNELQIFFINFYTHVGISSKKKFGDFFQNINKG
jgi:hypothetical protein